MNGNPLSGRDLDGHCDQSLLPTLLDMIPYVAVEEHPVCKNPPAGNTNQQQNGQQPGQQQHAINAKSSLWQRVKSSVANASYAINTFIITHSDLAMEANKSSFDYWSKQSNENIVKSLNPGGKEPMQVRPEVDSEGVVHMRVLNGNMRLNILQSRGADLGGLNPETLPPVTLEPFGAPNAGPEEPSEPIDIP